MAALVRRLAAVAQAALKDPVRTSTISNFTTRASSLSHPHFPTFRFRSAIDLHFRFLAAICGGTALYYYGSKWEVSLEEQPDQKAHNVGRFSFDPNVKLGLDVASCILTRAPTGGDAENVKYVIRPYTPISDPNTKGYFDLLVKVYPEGKMSKHLASLNPGDVVEVKGPIEKLRYSPNMRRHIGMIAGGTGITPMLQIIEAILKDPADNTQVSLLYANVSPDDILLKRKLDVLAAGHPNFKAFYTVDRSSIDWTGGTGYISKEMILKGLPSPSEDTLILVCGPPGMMKHISGEKAKDWSQGEVSGLLKELGYTESMVYKF